MKIKWDYLDWISKKVDGYGQEEYNDTLCTAISKASSLLFKLDIKNGGDTIFVNKNVFEIIKTLEFFEPIENKSKFVGKLLGRYFVYVDNFIKNNEVFVLNNEKPYIVKKVKILNYNKN